jgi:hypothetical protein
MRIPPIQYLEYVEGIPELRERPCMDVVRTNSLQRLSSEWLADYAAHRKNYAGRAFGAGNVLFEGVNCVRV